MDRTLIEPYKAEEKELSAKLYEKLQGLMLLFTPTMEFRKCCTNDMFIKQNQLAFFQVMHYLLRLHDPVEFKKRFYWPITDKQSEACFRSTTLEYLKFLSEKNQLNWNIKPHLVMMPGGMKFITFLLNLVGFVIREKIKLSEKHLRAEMSEEEISELTLNRMEKQNAFFKEYASNYITVIDENILELRSKTQELKQILTEMESSAHFCMNKAFLDEFSKSNKKLFEEKFVKNTQKIISLERPLNDTLEAIEKFQNNFEELRKEKSSLKQALQTFVSSGNNYDLEETLGTLLEFPVDPKINSLITAFIVIAPKVENWIGNVIKLYITNGSNFASDLIGLKNEYQKIYSQINDFQKKHRISGLENRGNKIFSMACCSPMMKYVYTPPIRKIHAQNISVRLPLQDETNMLDRTNTIIKTAWKKTKLNRTLAPEESFELNSTSNLSKKINARQLLRSIYKKSGLKWKEHHNSMFGNDKEPKKPLNIGKKYEPIRLFHNTSFHEQITNFVIKEQTPKTPFNAKSCIALNISHEKSSSTMLLKPSVVRKIQDSLFGVQNVGTSPSGRLESLIPAEKYINNLKEHAIESENEAKHISYSALNDDSIFNTSDTILKDIV